MKPKNITFWVYQYGAIGLFAIANGSHLRIQSLGSNQTDAWSEGMMHFERDGRVVQNM